MACGALNSHPGCPAYLSENDSYISDRPEKSTEFSTWQAQKKIENTSAGKLNASASKNIQINTFVALGTETMIFLSINATTWIGEKKIIGSISIGIIRKILFPGRIAASRQKKPSTDEAKVKHRGK